MIRHSVIAAAVAVATMTSAASIGFAQTQNGPHQRANVHHAYTYELAPNPYYYGPNPVVPLANAAGATVCTAFSLIGAC